jgi:hypothetical protein
MVRADGDAPIVAAVAAVVTPVHKLTRRRRLDEMSVTSSVVLSRARMPCGPKNSSSSSMRATLA